ncbi:MAG TPA: hypothetical protein DDW51_26930, partial [Cyanobacteria bacterium UBA11367]|nr:hypothetical protein [Cyanobacteria bacterium UBA11367]
KRRVLGEFLLRINYQQILGSFDLDFSDGEVRYKTSMSINNYSLTPAIIKDLVYTNVMMMSRYLPGIELVISGQMSPEEALAETDFLAE